MFLTRPAVVAAVSLFVLALGSYCSLPHLLPGDRLWRGYSTVVVDGSADIADVSRRLAEAGVDGVVSAATAIVEYSIFGGLEEARLADLPERLAEEDPRYDSYLRRLPGYFKTADGKRHVLYLPVSINPLAARRALDQVLTSAGIDWRLVGGEGPRRLVFPAFVVALAVVLGFKFRDRRTDVLALALPWAAHASAGTVPVVVASCLVYLSVVFLLEEAQPRIRRYLVYGGSCGGRELGARSGYLGLAVGFGAVLVMVSAPDPWRLLPFVCAVVASAAYFTASLALYAHRGKRREHRVFIPVRLLPRRGPLYWEENYGAIFASLFILILTVPIAAGILFRGPSEGVPRPESVFGVFGKGRAALERLSLIQDRPGALPDLSDYIAHRAYQTGLPYGRGEGFPSRDERVTIADFRVDRGVVIREARVVVFYGDSWYKESLERAKRLGVERLLLAELSAKRVVLGGPSAFPVDLGYLVLHGLAVGVLGLPFVRLYSSLRARLVVLLRLNPRRRQQEA